MKSSLGRKLAGEFLGTAFLLTAVVGSGIMGDRLAGGNVAITLLANSMATGAALIALIVAFGPISGAHFNPAVTLAEALHKNLQWSIASLYMVSQVLGAITGVGVAHLMFHERVFAASLHDRSGITQCFSEFVATFGLLLVIRSCSRMRPPVVAIAVGCYIAGAYWFTASTSFANPAVTLARTMTDTFAGIRGADMPGFISAQLAGALAAAWLGRWLMPLPREDYKPAEVW